MPGPVLTAEAPGSSTRAACHPERAAARRNGPVGSGSAGRATARAAASAFVASCGERTAISRPPIVQMNAPADVPRNARRSMTLRGIAAGL
jgi:hypothetical protein